MPFNVGPQRRRHAPQRPARSVGLLLGAWVLALCFVVQPVQAQNTPEIAKQAQNPIASLISVPFENDFNPRTGINKEDSYVMEMKPVVPLTLSNDWNLITRTIIPVIQVPDLAPGVDGTSGIGDVQTSLFLSPAKTGAVIWGAGPMVSFPTASQEILGTKKLSVGPTVVVLKIHGHWLFGTLVQNLFSVAGPSARPNVNQTLMQPFANYNLKHGWYLTSSPIITANWEVNPNQRWVVPVGGGAGKIVHFGKRPVNIYAQLFRNVERPDGTIPQTGRQGFRCNCYFPKHERNKKVKAIQVRTTGGPEVLVLRELPDPVPQAGEALIRVHTSGVNFMDVYFREGKYKTPLPFIPGGEGSGHVEALGAGVTDLSVGDAVAWLGSVGSYAERVVVPADRLVKVPAGLDLQKAAALMVQGITAYYLSHLTFALRPGHTALVHASAGGVGFLLTQMAKNVGVTVIATTSTPEKAELARQAGADDIILYTKMKFDEEVMRITNGDGVDVVYDGVGQATFEQSLKCLRRRGLLALYEAASGPVPPFDLARLSTMGSLFVTRPISLDYVKTREELTFVTDAVFGMYKAGQLTLVVSRAYALGDAAKAHIDLESRGTTGKLVLTTSASTATLSVQRARQAD
jgi:NADPH2:quinone reductase